MIKLTLLVLFLTLASLGIKCQTIIINNQEWSTKNLDVTNYRNGDPILEVKDVSAWAKLTTGAWCYYNNDSTNGSKYGKLYNWYAINDPRGLAPDGWHIPKGDEWMKLINYFGGLDNAGKKIASRKGWSKNGEKTDKSPFYGPPGGLRYWWSDPSFNDLGYSSSWWSSTETTISTALFFSSSYDKNNIYKGSEAKLDGRAVRCVRN